MKLRRLNMDTSWEVDWADKSFLIDPWLYGSEVDYFSWFNEQWHTQEPLKKEDINHPGFILISQSYSDHCHEITIDKLDKDIPILASPKAYKRLQRSQKKGHLIELPLLSKQGLLDYEGFQIASIDPGNKMDPVYYAHIIARDGKAIFYSSHGFDLSKAQLDLLSQFDIHTLLTSFSTISLPSILGGKVNPGLSNVQQLVDQLNPKYLINSHDEKKIHKGLVMKLAKTFYPDLEQLKFPNTQFLNFTNYDFQNLN